MRRWFAALCAALIAGPALAGPINSYPVVKPTGPETVIGTQSGVTVNMTVASIADAVAMYEKARDASEHGASKMPQVKIVAADGFFLYGIAYNGRVWELGKDGSQVFLDGMSGAEWVRHCTAD